MTVLGRRQLRDRRRRDAGGLVGESGCGKTTTARCVLRAMPPTSGEVRVAHDLSVVKHVCGQVVVMYVGQIVEMGPTAAIFAGPDRCRAEPPAFREVAPGHLARCHLAEELTLEGVGGGGPGATA